MNLYENGEKNGYIKQFTGISSHKEQTLVRYINTLYYQGSFY